MAGLWSRQFATLRDVSTILVKLLGFFIIGLPLLILYLDTVLSLLNFCIELYQFIANLTN